jgi:NAD(P)-dependent dehydrogenase (short-subunit alcohol dehydrogenase family)
VSYEGEVVVITGGASGFGLGLADECAQRGMRVVLLDRDGARAEREAGALGGAHGIATFSIEVDVAVDDQVRQAALEVAERFDRVDVLVSNVGVQLFGDVEHFTDAEWQWMLDVNVVGAARTVRAFLPYLRRADRPRLAFTTSSSVLSPASRLGAYQATKFAVWGLAETLRLELAGEVAVSVIFPSGMTSRHLESSTEAQPEHVRRVIGQPEDFEQMMASNPDMTTALLTPEEAALRAVEAILAGEPYVVTHGDLVGAVSTRDDALRRAAEAARTG